MREILFILRIIKNALFVVFEDDLDGYPNRQLIDEDEDGKPDLIAFDFNQDGVWDKFENIDNGFW